MVNRITNTADGIKEDNCGRENSRIGLLKLIDDITDFIFVKNLPQKSDIIFIPGSSKYEVSICAAELFHQNFADYILPSGKHSVKNKEFSQEYIRGTPYEGAYRTDWEFCCHVLTGHGVGEDRIWKEDRSGHIGEQLVSNRRGGLVCHG